MNAEQNQKIDALLETTQIDEQDKALMKVFFDSISNQPQFSKIVDLLTRFPNVMNNFCKCFTLKQDFKAQGKTADDLDQLFTSEEQVFKKLE